MAAQLNYGYSTPKAVPGAKVDLSDDVVVARINDENDGVLKYGVAVAQGTNAGHSVKKVVNGTSAGQIDGVLVALPNTEQDMNGNVIVKKNAALSVMNHGKIWGRLGTEVTPVYGNTAYVIVDGDDAGCFTTRSSSYSHYVQAESTTAGAKEVVADSTPSPTSGQIKLGSVTPVIAGYTPAVGDYVVSKEVHGTTVNINAKFGNASDSGIAVIVLA